MATQPSDPLLGPGPTRFGPHGLQGFMRLAVVFVWENSISHDLRVIDLAVLVLAASKGHDRLLLNLRHATCIPKYDARRFCMALGTYVFPKP